MPWISEDKCVGCGICVERCPVGAISMTADKAVIDMEGCIRCGVCHKACSYEAVRHDSERIPLDVDANVDMTRRFMSACIEHLKDESEGPKCLNRMKKHFNKQKIVAEKTLERLDQLK